MFFSERGELQPWQVLAFALIFDPETTKPSFKTSLWLVSIYVAASSLSRSTILGQNLHISLFIHLPGWPTSGTFTIGSSAAEKIIKEARNTKHFIFVRSGI